ncbi:cadherin repeat domain-containing protein, partial [Oceanobacter sp. 3_MG-2023]|uniref:beta strand repeat-containing protein n=2 Tax=unclassified Oceanobacter TaxID=2620260 RepID=UPI002735682E
GSTATAIDENSGENTVIYTAATDDATAVYSLSGADAALFSINSATGEVTLLADADYETKPSYSFTVTATDGAGNHTDQIVTLAVNNLDEAVPSITSGATATAIDENSGAGQVVYTATADDSADISDGVTFSLSGDDAAYFSIDAVTGEVTLLADADYETKSSYSFIVTATDGASLQDSQAVTLDVNDLDEVAPAFTSGSTATAIDENSGENTVIYTAATDDATAVYSLSGADAGLFSINSATGEVTLLADANYETKSSYSFTVIATDGAGNHTDQLVTLDVNNLDEIAPTITSGATATAINENSGAGQVVYTAVADDSADISDGVTFSLSGADAAYFSIDASTGEVTLLADADYETKSSYSFTVTATDGAGNHKDQAVTLAVNNLDEAAPSITSGATATSIDENSGAGQVVYTATADDSADISDGVTFSLSGTGAAYFSIDASTGEVTLLADADYETKPSYSFTVTATDGAGNHTDQAVTLAVNDLDEVAPTITSGDTATAIDENSGAGQVVYTAVADDSVDISDGVTFSLSGTDAAYFSIDASTGEVTLLADADYETKSSYNFTVIATDGVGHFTDQTVTLAVNNLDEVGPVFTSGTLADAIDENSGASSVIYTAATDDATAVYSLSGADAGLFSINSATGEVTLLADADYETKSSYSFTVTATDGAGNFTDQTVTLAVNNLDEVAPTITSGDTATAIVENSGAGQVVYTAAADDDSADISDGVTFSLSGTDAAYFSIDASTGEVTLLADADYETKPNYSFTVTATDGAGHFTDQTVTLAVNDLDESGPVFNSGSLADAIDENSGASSVIYTATTNDAPAVYSLSGADAAYFSINSATGEVTLLADADYETKDSYNFTVTAIDGAGNHTDQIVTLAVNNLDEVAPSITSGATATAIDENSGAGSVIYTATADDSADISDGVSFSLSGADAAYFSINPATGEVTLLADADYETKPNYSFTVTATDGAGHFTDQTVTLAVNDLDESGPVFNSGSLADAIDESSGASSVIYTATTNDATAVYSLSGADAAYFSINSATGEVTLLADADYETKDSYNFTVTAIDGAGNHTDQIVTLAVNNLDEVAPTITSGATATAIDENSGAGQVVYTAIADDSTDISDGVTFSLSGTDASRFSINSATGEVTLLADADYETKPSYNFTVTATDGAGNFTNQAVTLAVNNLDEVAPTITSGDTATAIDENSGAVVYTAIADDSTDISDGVTFSLSGDDAAYFSIDTSTGEVTLLADADYETKASYSFVVTATDGAGHFTDQTVTLDVNDLDEVGPVFTSGTLADVIDENSGENAVIYTATTDDATAVYSLSGADAGLFSI